MARAPATCTRPLPHSSPGAIALLCALAACLGLSYWPTGDPPPHPAHTLEDAQAPGLSLEQMAKAAAGMGLSKEQFDSLIAGFQILHRPRSRGGGTDPVTLGVSSSRSSHSSIGRRGRRESTRRRLQQKVQVGSNNYTAGEKRDDLVADRPSAGNRTAICLVGGARTFEVTGPSILHFLLRQLEPHADLFLNSPMDADSAKMGTLAHAASIAAVRIFPVVDIDPDEHPTAMLRSLGSPKGVQGLLQYFSLVEGCARLVHEYEEQAGVSYTWIIRTRLDAFWSGPVPPLHKLQTKAYTIPWGSDWGGYNDRFGVGSRRTSQVALKRLSLLRDIQRMTNFKWLNSEAAYKLQLDLHNVPVARAHFPFCILTHRFNPGTSTSPCHPFFFSIQSWLPLDGAKCMPCKPCTSQFVDPAHKGFLFCDLTVDPWEEGQWQKRCDEAAGPYFAKQRLAIASTSLAQCVPSFNRLRQKAVIWESGPAEAICLRSVLGKTQEVGSQGQGKSFNLFVDLLNRTSCILAPALVEAPDPDASWEGDLQGLVGGVHVEKRNLSMAQLKGMNGDVLDTWGYKHLDVLKLSANGAEVEALEHWLGQALGKKDAELPIHFPVCQLLIGFGHPHKEGGLLTAQHGSPSDVVHRMVPRVLKALGMQLESCVQGASKFPMRCLFYSLAHCPMKAPAG